MSFHFHALKRKETLVVEEVPAEILSRDPRGLAVDAEVTKI
jgi:hypothetical protein